MKKMIKKVFENIFYKIPFLNRIIIERDFYRDECVFFTKQIQQKNQQLDEIYKKYPKSQKDITTIRKKDNERLLPELYKNNSTEYILFLRHIFAYNFATKYLQNNYSVLDFGCGDGYGSDFLASCLTKGYVVGTDIDLPTIEKAKKKYQRRNLTFDNIDKVFKFPANQFDVVVSFQVIEHVENVNQYLQALKRLLKSNGILLISTPSHDYRLTKNQKPWNEFHLREYSANDLQKDIEKVFPKTKIMSLKATNEILQIEYNRVASNRDNHIPYKKLFPADLISIFPEKFSIKDFYLDKVKLNDGLDLYSISKK